MPARLFDMWKALFHACCVAICFAGRMQAAPVSTAVELGEAPRTKKPPEANRLVKWVGFEAGVENRRLAKNESKTFLDEVGNVPA